MTAGWTGKEPMMDKEGRHALDAELLSLLLAARDGLLWCSGHDDFAVGGRERIGWERGPGRALNDIELFDLARRGIVGAPRARE